MISMLLLAAAAMTPTAVDAERAFARDSQRIGQWSAFRRYADPDAVMFTPQAVWAHEFLKDRKDPPRSLRWSPSESFVSCDGRTAVNSGPWASANGKSNGYFTTVWQRDKGRWLWVYDGGDDLAAPRARRTQPRVRRASCRGTPKAPPMFAMPPAVKRVRTGPPADAGRGLSADRTLAWVWRVEGKGARQFRTFLWNGSHYEQVLYNQTSGT
ncbi:MAG: hypothetical protein ABIW16_00210 [Sphingomicrobium sp.]